jgi:hypothetical protein
MDRFSRIQTPDDFESTVFTRAFLSSLPNVTLDPTFEAAVLKKVRYSKLAPWFATVGIVAVLTISYFGYSASQPDVVVIQSVPQIEATANVENLPPAPLHVYPDPPAANRPSKSTQNWNGLPVTTGRR